MKVKIWGARGSVPTPLTAQAIREKIVAALQGAQGIDLGDPMAILAYVDGLPLLASGTAGGNTSCVELQVGERTIVIDAGTGIRLLGRELMAGPCGRGRGVVHLFFSHTHWDHIQGLPFFDPAYIPGNRIYIYSVDDVARMLADQMKPAVFPVSFQSMQANIQFVPLIEGHALTLGDVRITNLRLPHPGNAFAYRFEHRDTAVVCATDAEYKNLDEAHLQPFIRFYAAADVLIFDAQYALHQSLVKEDWGHSSALIGLDLARRAGVKRLVLFHHDPNSSDADLANILAQTAAYQAAHESDIACQVMLANEGLTIDLLPPASFSLHWSPPAETASLAIRDGFDQQAVTQVVHQITETPGATRLPKLVIDLSGVTQLSIASLRGLIDLQRQWQDTPLALACLSPQASQVIELTNYLDFFEIYPTVPLAQAALEAREILRLPGQLLKERYRIEAKQGENDLGVLFEATDVRLERRVSVQVLSPSLGRVAMLRMLRKARKLANLQSPNIVTLFDCDQDRGLAYLVTEYVSEQTLRQVMDREDRPSPLDIAIGILSALEYAHGKGIVHGNLKPASVLIDGGVKLKDFGLTWLEEGRPLTVSPLLIEDPHYLAPEQILGQHVDERTDLYTFGIILYELFTGRRPFEGSTSEVLDQHLRRSPTPPREINPKLAHSIEYLILRLLAKQPEQRYAAASQVRRILLGLEVAPELLAAGVAPSRQRSLVGRDAQLQNLLMLWDSARQGQGQVVIVAGEAGVGKTRLVEEVAAQLSNIKYQTPDDQAGQTCPAEGLTISGRRAMALLGHCSELEGSSPYQPFVEIVRGYLACVTLADLHKQLGDAAPVLATLVPEINHLVPDLLPLAPLRPEQEQLRLRHSFTQFVGRMAGAHPWLLILEDLHWTDQASLQLFHHLARFIPSWPVMVIGTYRDVELDPSHPLRELLQALSRSSAYHHVALNRLDQDAVRRMLEQIWQPGVPEAWVTAIYEHTGGNPFYVQEVAKSLSEEEAVTLQEGTWHFTPIAEIKLPQSVRDVVLRRVARTSPPTQEMLRRAAVLGQQFSFADLLAVGDQPEEQAIESLDEALERYLIREVDSEGGLAFSHTEIPQVIYDDMSLKRRQVLHRRIAIALEQRAQRTEDLDSMSEQLAYHFVRAGDREKGFAYSLQAAEHAVAVYAYQTALTRYNQVLALLPSMEEASNPARRAQIYHGWGRTLQMLARYEEAAEAFQEMQAAAEESGDAVAQARAWNEMAFALDFQPNYRGELEMATRAEEIARAVANPLQKASAQVELAFALYRKGWALFRLGDSEKALDLGEQALALSTELGAQREMAESLNLIGTVLTVMGRYEQSEHYHRRALALHREMGNLWRVTSVLNNLGENARQRGDYRAALAMYEEALPIARQIGARHAEILIPSNIGGTLVAMGDCAAGETYLRQVIAVAEKTDAWVVAETWRFLAEACLGQGRIEEALEAGQRALALGQEIELQEDIGGAWRALGMAAAELEIRKRAARAEGQRTEDGRATPIESGPPLTLQSLALIPQPLESASCFTASLRIYTQIGAEGERARTLRAWAQCELRQGHRETAQKMWREAREIFARLGMGLEVGRMAESAPE